MPRRSPSCLPSSPPATNDPCRLAHGCFARRLLLFFSKSLKRKAGGRGEIGRRNGLKIRRAARPVPVRFRSPAPLPALSLNHPLSFNAAPFGPARARQDLALSQVNTGHGMTGRPIIIAHVSVRRTVHVIADQIAPPRPSPQIAAIANRHESGGRNSCDDSDDTASRRRSSHNAARCSHIHNRRSDRHSAATSIGPSRCRPNGPDRRPPARR